jgi:hypothetical protein
MRRAYHGRAFYLFLPLFLIFFAVPYLFDIVYCEELYGTPLSQAALIDGEKVDPHKDPPSSQVVNLEVSLQRKHHLVDSVLLPLSLKSGSARMPMPPLLAARPPPVR